MKKIKIGIIDGYYRNDEEKNIITVNNSKIQNINNFHTKIILDLIKNKLGDSCERNIEFIILPILNLNNFGELRDLYWALEKCLLMDVDIINVSLGTNRVIKNKIIDKLIGELKKKGILIVSSFDNSNNPETYIASSPLVMGVESSICGYSYIYKNDNFYKIGKNICFKYNDVLLKGKRFTGNSYLCAKIVGVLSKKMLTGKKLTLKNKDLLISFKPRGELINLLDIKNNKVFNDYENYKFKERIDQSNTLFINKNYVKMSFNERLKFLDFLFKNALQYDLNVVSEVEIDNVRDFEIYLREFENKGLDFIKIF
ncbi:hypothetical protein [Anaerococcus hydrogenalis]|uniref:Peptidase S8/S53 domain-containing protein n=1 Tax=Anaerococcus hydrogenalis ACS-025-V-Sch4 TaxID=879306 RepID=F0H2S2_9FIRM|nr:hypothetical protein [Anaerococcus hydrogenalis]EGC83226.1 hypothetical protein HMPREF9246_0371 [Anaerococcus hydrogenalis ACS-025-V-Sch4]